MAYLILRRLLALVPMLIIVSLITFVLVALMPGDIAATLAGDNASPERLAQIRAELGLDHSFWNRYFEWAGAMLQGDFGKSMFNGAPVSDLLLQRLPATLSLTFVALLFALLIGVPAGILAAISRNPLVDRLVMGMSVMGVAVPSYVFALFFILLFSLQLRWFPMMGYKPLSADPFRWFYHLVLPGLAMAGMPAAVIARQLRGSLREVMGSDYIRTAQAKGLGFYAILFGHAMRNALGAPLAALSVQVAMLLSGAVAIEVVFGMPGLGQLAMVSVGLRDVTAVQGVVILGAAIVMGVNLLVDILYMLINPKVAVTA